MAETYPASDEAFVRKMVAEGGHEGHPGMPVHWLPGAAAPAFRAMVARGEIKIIEVVKPIPWSPDQTRTLSYAVLTEKEA